MQIVEEHLTPDAMFRLIVTRCDDGDVALGFDGFPWHTHGDILAALSGLPIDEAVRQFIQALQAGRSFIGISRVAGEITSVWVTDDPRHDKYKPEDETMEFRDWHGRPAG